ncbi:MAG: DNA-binding protein Alba [bacterium]|nr:DNA-binding protein Alba [bacterium]
METEKKERTNDNVVFIGEKPFMNYVTAVVMQFTTLGAPEVVIKARGKFIAKAVDIAEVATKRFLENQVKSDNILIDSAEFTNKEGRQVRVSSIEIYLKK